MMSNHPRKFVTLNEDNIQAGIKHLIKIDPDLHFIYHKYGPPPMWNREPGFPTLVRIILEQQVSLASAKSAFDKLEAKIQPLSPTSFLELKDVELKTIGFSRQKTKYCRNLSEMILTGRLHLESLVELESPKAKEVLLQIKGIGSWSADIYLLMALQRTDVWPAGDLALATAVQKLKNLATRPDCAKLEKLAVSWRPWRAIAARMLWHFYLSS